MVRRLTAGGNRIRTIGPAEKETAVERGPAADHRRLARGPVRNDPIQLIGPASLVGNSRETFHKSGTDGSNPVPSSGESGNFRSLSGGARIRLHAPCSDFVELSLVAKSSRAAVLQVRIHLPPALSQPRTGPTASGDKNVRHLYAGITSDTDDHRIPASASC